MGYFSEAGDALNPYERKQNKKHESSQKLGMTHVAFSLRHCSIDRSS